MKPEKIVIGNLGEIGSAIYKIFDAAFGYDKHTKGAVIEGNKDKIVHVCIPYNKDFVSIVKEYIIKLQPVLTIIHTTCPVGTTRSIYDSLYNSRDGEYPIVHCPINGKHPNMEPDIRRYTMFVGAIKEKHGQIACEYIEWHNIDTYLCETPEITEVSKLASTELIRVNIEFYQKMKKGIKDDHLNWAEFVAFMQNIMDKGIVYKRIYQRAGKIDGSLSGKHCISENEKLV